MLDDAERAAGFEYLEVGLGSGRQCPVAVEQVQISYRQHHIGRFGLAEFDVLRGTETSVTKGLSASPTVRPQSRLYKEKGLRACSPDDGRDASGSMSCNSLLNHSSHSSSQNNREMIITLSAQRLGK